MTIGLIYAMRGEIESLLNTENAEPLQSAAGVEFYQIRPNVIACIGGVSKVNAAMATELLISLYHPDLVLNVGVAGTAAGKADVRTKSAQRWKSESVCAIILLSLRNLEGKL